jgi:hypothetical protein
MNRLVLISFLIAVCAVPEAVSACTYSQRPEPVGHASGQYFAIEMLNAATYADLVLVEDDGTRGGDARPTGVITVRTIARFKGKSPDRFTLFGEPLTFSPDKERIFSAPLQHFTSETGQVTPFPYTAERPSQLIRYLASAGTLPPPPPPPMTSCSPPGLSAETGRFYVVLRDSDGRILNRLTMSDGRADAPNHPAFGFVPVTLSDEDFWLYSVRLAAHPDTSDTAIRLLHLRPGSSAVSVERGLRAAGATIRAAYYSRGDIVEEVRPAPHEQGGVWLERADTHLETSRRGGIGDPHHGAAEFLRGKLAPNSVYSPGLGYEVAQAFIQSVREEQQATGAPRLIAIEVAGNPIALAGLPFVDRIGPLDREVDRLPQISGADEAATFATMQRIEHDLWLLNGGNGNRQGTLPRRLD